MTAQSNTINLKDEDNPVFMTPIVANYNNNHTQDYNSQINSFKISEINNLNYLDQENLSICENNYCMSELYSALKENNKDKFINLLINGANPNSGLKLDLGFPNHVPPINLAANFEDDFYLLNLIKYGAEINTHKLNKTDHVTKSSPLIEAIQSNLVKNVLILLEAGAVADLLYCNLLTCDGMQYTPLNESLFRKYDSITNALLNFRVNLELGKISTMVGEQKNQYFFTHKTPLYIAIESKDATTIALLLQNGASAAYGKILIDNISRNFSNQSSYDLAYSYDDDSIVSIIDSFPCTNNKLNHLNHAEEILEYLSVNFEQMYPWL